MNTDFLSYLHIWLYPSFNKKLFLFFFLSVLFVVSTIIVYWSGGTHTAFTHFFYLPVIISGLVFSIPGGIIASLVAGLMLGPWMPNDTQFMTLQPAFSWLARCFFFCFIGGLSGLSSAIFRNYIKELELKFITNEITGLPNIYGLEQFFRTLPSKQCKKIVVIETRNLSQIERVMGAKWTEDLVRQAGKFLASFVEDAGYVGHIDKATFAIIFSDLTQFEIFFTKKKPEIPLIYMINDIPVFVEFYYGISESPQDHVDFLQLLRQARVAIEASVQDKKVISIYKPLQDQEREKNLHLLHELHTQLGKTEDLYLAYQPKIDLRSGQTIGVEALVRWQHKVFGLISPAEFTPLIENTLLIHPFTLWVIEQALKDFAEWQRQGIHTTIAINFSLHNLHSKELQDRMISLLKQYKAAAQSFQVEVTESASTYEMSQVAEVLHSFRAKGMKVWIDDYGTGQASLQYLLSLPIDGLKICPDFTRLLGKTPSVDAIVKSTILLAHDLNLQVIAEGIETKEQYQKLKDFGCDMGQGYYFAKPLPASEMSLWLFHQAKEFDVKKP